MRDLIVFTMVDPSYLAYLHTAQLPVYPVYLQQQELYFLAKDMTDIDTVTFVEVICNMTGPNLSCEADTGFSFFSPNRVHCIVARGPVAHLYAKSDTTPSIMYTMRPRNNAQICSPASRRSKRSLHCSVRFS
jgi:hypothetical protein